jgi:hypothetical protein
MCEIVTDGQGAKPPYLLDIELSEFQTQAETAEFCTRELTDVEKMSNAAPNESMKD